VYLDIDKVADTTHPVAHMLPTPQFFAESIAKVGTPVQNKYLLLLPLPAQFLIVSYRHPHCLQLGVSSGDDVVVYDTQGIFASPRYVCGRAHLMVNSSAADAVSSLLSCRTWWMFRVCPRDRMHCGFLWHVILQVASLCEAHG
jgi:hypothetical protein